MTSCYDNRVITRLDFDTREEFAQQLEDIVKFHAMNDAWRGIDPPSEYVREHFIAASAGRFMKPLPILQPQPLKVRHECAAGTPLVQAA
ncbi:MAG: hypothetical protein OXG04_23810 [Acidobacteria bacterium]|nr:hypothetical protein [Acidobacteriota bacterium]